MRVLRPWRFLLRAEMIGRKTVEARRLDLGATDTLGVDLVLPVAPVALDAIGVTGVQKCLVRPQAGGETHAVWEEARKALAVEAALRADNTRARAQLRGDHLPGPARRAATAGRDRLGHVAGRAVARAAERGGRRRTRACGGPDRAVSSANQFTTTVRGSMDAAPAPESLPAL